jgi:hypothetical protein
MKHRVSHISGQCDQGGQRGLPADVGGPIPSGLVLAMAFHICCRMCWCHIGTPDSCMQRMDASVGLPRRHCGDTWCLRFTCDYRGPHRQPTSG